MLQHWLPPSLLSASWQMGYRLHPVLHSLVAHRAKVLHRINFQRKLRPKPRVVSLPGPVRSRMLQLCMFLSMAAEPRGLPFPVPFWSSVLSSAWAWSSAGVTSSCALLSFLELSLLKKFSVRFHSLLKSDELMAWETLPITNSLQKPLYCILVMKD